ncbi:MAG TPA: ACP S-malonyltransferase [Chloroflexota bacterium]|nr:ACP S-malonyltransferase [Chloroflexota bacterium]
MRSALLFPGQGAQRVGMGADLVERSPAARAIFDRAEAEADLPLARLCAEGPEEALRATEVAQPALVAVELAALAALAERLGTNGEELGGVAGALGAEWVAGHSLGEYAACVVAGALSTDDALRLAAERGRLMAEARTGTMAAVLGLEAGTLEEICRSVGGVEVANDNAPGQLVVSGAPAAVEAAGALARRAGARRVIPLNVSGAFHSGLMSDAAARFAERLDGVTIHDPTLAIIGNVTAEPIGSAAALRDELRHQIARPVRWRASLLRIRDSGAERAFECGPGDTLAGLARRTVPELPVRALGRWADVEAVAAELAESR